MNKSPTWAHLKARIDTIDRVGLIGIIRDLYDAAGINRRFLHARFVPTGSTLDEYRRLVRAAVFPDPFCQRPIRLRDATATISEYKRATGDVGGTIDLMLEFVEAGTEQAADLGYGDEPYFGALERKVTEIVRALDTLSDTDRNGRQRDSFDLANMKEQSVGAMATFSRMLRRNCSVARRTLAPIVHEPGVESEIVGRCLPITGKPLVVGED